MSRGTFLTLRIAIFTSAVPLLMRLPLRRVQALVEPVGCPAEMDVALAEKIVRDTERMVRLTARINPRRCLARGLTLYFFLRRAGFDLSLVFGAGTVENDFAGHCWLERNGEPYLEATDPRNLFTPMYRFTRRGDCGPRAQEGRA